MPSWQTNRLRQLKEMSVSRLKPFDAFFLATETRRSPWHMAGCEVFEYPQDAEPAAFLDGLERDMRKQSPVAPFNQVLDNSGLWPVWREAEVDLDYHFHRMVLPSPGSEAQFMAALEHFCAATLDRNLPLWECLLIEGLEGNRFAIAFKVHHALTDGQGGLKMVLRAMGTRRSERKARALWGDNTPAGSRHAASKRSERKAKPGRKGLMPEFRPAAWLRQARDLRLFRAPPSALNQRPESSARRFGLGDLPLDQVKAVAKRSGTSINDVLLCVVDAAVHRYLGESGRTPSAELVVGMPVSLREEGQEGGNQAGLLTVELGSSGASESRRLAVIHENTQRAKQHLRELPSGFLMAYGMTVLGLPLLTQGVPGLNEKYPVINMGVSNVSPPRGSNYLDKSLYLRGARLTGLYTQPILPPSVLLNVTAASMNGKLCLGIGSTREAVDRPLVLMQYIGEALDKLEAQLAA
jgi:diacylglycerol O-acyltransferase / wax synthase